MESIKNSRVIVTGGSGFLGTHIVKECEKHGPSEIFVPRSKEYDLTNIEQVRKMFKYFPADYVIHCAADVGGIAYNKENPGSILFNNSIMNLIVQEEARKNNVKKFIGIGSVCSYPKYTPVPFHENNLWDGYPEETNAPYGLSKKLLLEQSRAYRAQYNFNAIHLLMINLYGPGDNFDLFSSHVIPALIRKVHQAKKKQLTSVEVWGDGSATREFLYVEDAARAVLLAAERYDSSEPVNIGSGIEISIKDLLEMIVDLLSYNGDIIWDKSKPNGQPRRCLDVSKAESMFQFTAKYDFKEGLKKTIEWYIDKENE